MEKIRQEKDECKNLDEILCDIIRHDNGSIEAVLTPEIEELRQELWDADYAYFHNRLSPDFKYIMMYEALDDSTLELELFNTKDGIKYYEYRIKAMYNEFKGKDELNKPTPLKNHAVHTSGCMYDDKYTYKVALKSDDNEDYLPFTELVFTKK